MNAEPQRPLSPPDPTPDDVMHWIHQLRSEDPRAREEARRQIDRRFAAMLKAAIRERLNPRIRQRVGASDVYQVLMHSFFVRHEAGDYVLPDSDALLRLFFEMMRNKVINARHHHRRKKRAVEREMPLLDGDSDGDGLEQFAKRARPTADLNKSPYRRNLARVELEDRRGDSIFAEKDLVQLLTIGAAPGDAAEVEEVYDRVKAALGPQKGLVFDLRLAGFADREIAEEINKTQARVRQIFGEIRKSLMDVAAASEFGEAWVREAVRCEKAAKDDEGKRLRLG